MDGEIGLFEAVQTTRAMRRLKTDPVPDALIRRVLEAATCAPTGGNRQAWGFLVVRDPEVKRRVQVFYERTFRSVLLPHYTNGPLPPGVSAGQHARQTAAVQYLTEHFHEAPVWIVACARESGPVTPTSAASIFPAVQNILLACRALGLGATLTTRHTLEYGAEVDALLGLPEGVRSYAIVPVGYPMGNFGPVRRVPLAEVVFQDRWGQPWPGAADQ